MKYKCEKCHDTGSIDKSGDYLDCGHCDAAMQRAAMNDFLDKLPAMGDYDAAWLVHQRALAMAPKQDAAACQDCDGRGFNYGESAYGGDGFMQPPDPPTQERCEVCEGSGIEPVDSELIVAAPAAANGALTDDADLGEGLPSLPEAIEVGGQGWGWEDFQSEKVFSAEHMFNYARAAIAAAGPDAALVTLIQKAQSILAKHLPPDGPDAKTTISALLGLLDGPESRAALSGAKGN